MYKPGANSVVIIPPSGKRRKEIIIQGFFLENEPNGEKEERMEVLAKNFLSFGLNVDA